MRLYYCKVSSNYICNDTDVALTLFNMTDFNVMQQSLDMLAIGKLLVHL